MPILGIPGGIGKKWHKSGCPPPPPPTYVPGGLSLHPDGDCAPRPPPCYKRPPWSEPDSPSSWEILAMLLYKLVLGTVFSRLCSCQLDVSLVFGTVFSRWCSCQPRGRLFLGSLVKISEDEVLANFTILISWEWSSQDGVLVNSM